MTFWHFVFRVSLVYSRVINYKYPEISGNILRLPKDWSIPNDPVHHRLHTNHVIQYYVLVEFQKIKINNHDDFWSLPYMQGMQGVSYYYYLSFMIFHIFVGEIWVFQNLSFFFNYLFSFNCGTAAKYLQKHCTYSIDAAQHHCAPHANFKLSHRGLWEGE